MLLGDDEVLPFWLERQLDASGPSFVPAGAEDPPASSTHRDWTLVGTLSSLARATVDPRGMVTPVEGGWSLDWWVGSGERWHLPSREAAVRQSLVDGTPVVATSMRVPNGDVVQRAYAVREPDGSSSVVVEVENRSAHAVALALVIRPWHPLGRARVAQVAVEGAVVEVDGQPGLVLDRLPAAVHLTAGGRPRLLEALGRPGDAPPGRPAGAVQPLTAPDGRGEAAVVVPLPHTAVARAVLPLPDAPARRSRGRRPDPVRDASGVPSAEQVASGWVTQGARGPRLVVPDDRLAALVEANRRHLLLVHAGEDLAAVPWVPFDYTEAATELAALDAFGFDEEAAMVLGTWEERQSLDGHLLGDDRRWEANGAALAALATHWRLTDDLALPEALVGPVAKAAHWIDKRRASRRRRRDGATGLLPEGDLPRWLGPPGRAFRTDWWSLRGLRDAAALLAALDQPEAAADAEASAAALDAQLVEAMGAAAEPHGGVLPAGPDRGVDGGIVAIVDAVLLGVLEPTSPLVDATLAAIAERFDVDGAVVQAVGAAGLSPRLTARLARVELARGDRRALDRLRWLVEHATTAATWPEVVHPRTGGGASGAGHDGVAAAEFLLAVRDLLVHDEPEGLVLAPVVPDAWLGQGWEVHDLPTERGTFGYAVRWHGDRPALLWQLDVRAGAGPVRLRAPGLDPDWSTTEPAGEALLAPVRPAEEAAPADDAVVAPTGADEGAETVVEVALPPVRRPASPRRDPAGGADDGGEGSSP